MRDKNTRMQLGDMTAFINSSLNPRGANDKNGERMANYIFTRAHDTEAQTIIQRIIRDRINPNLFGYNFTRDEIKKASRFTMRILIRLTRLMRHTTCHLSMPSC